MDIFSARTHEDDHTHETRSVIDAGVFSYFEAEGAGAEKSGKSLGTDEVKFVKEEPVSELSQDLSGTVIDEAMQENSKALKERSAESDKLRKEQEVNSRRHVQGLYGGHESEAMTQAYRDAIRVLRNTQARNDALEYCKNNFSEVAEQHSALQNALENVGLTLDAQREAINQKRSALTNLGGRSDAEATARKRQLNESIADLEADLTQTETTLHALEEALAAVESETTPERLQDGYTVVRNAAEALAKKESTSDYKTPGKFASMVLDKFLPMAQDAKATLEALKHNLDLRADNYNAVEVFDKNIDVLEEIVGQDIPSAKESVEIVALRKTIRTAQKLKTIYMGSKKIVEESERLAGEGFKPIELREINGVAKIPLSALSGLNVAILSAVALPDIFENFIRGSGAHVVLGRRLGDQHPFKTSDLDAFYNHAVARNARLVVMDAGDQVRVDVKYKPRLPTFYVHFEMVAAERRIVESIAKGRQR